MDASIMSLDLEAYKNYSPPFLEITYAIGYGLSYAVLSSSIVFTVSNHGKDIISAFQGNVKKMFMLGLWKSIKLFRSGDILYLPS